METTKLNVPSISCPNCVARIEKELAKVAGILSAKADAVTKSVSLTANDTSAVDRAREALQRIGYPPEPSV